MNKRARTLFAALAAVLCIFILPAFASTKLSSSELEALLAPYAMYPDSMLGNILIASARPDELEAAQAWLGKHPGLSADQVTKESEKESWDDSVKALLIVPDTLNQMCKDIDNTQKLGDAFVSQNADVMDSVQSIRKSAVAAGTLKSTKDVTVKIDEQGCVSIGAVDPNVVAVPKTTSNTKSSTAAASTDTSAQATKSSSPNTGAIIWGCLALSRIVYACCVVDWDQHRYWYGPAYNHCYYANGAFRAWSARCTVPPAMRAAVPPAPARPAYSPGHANWVANRAANRAAVTRSTSVRAVTPRGAAATNVHATPTGPARTTVRVTPAGASATTVKATPAGVKRTTSTKANPLRRHR